VIVGVLIVVVGVVKVVGGVMADMVKVVLRVGIEVVEFNLDIKLFFWVNLFGCI
jgi:hypothetical protein